MTETGGQPPVSFPVAMSPCSSFLLRWLTRRGINAACGQCPASGGTDGRFTARLASVTVYASLSPFSDERPSAAFADSLLSERSTAAVFHGRPDPLPDAVNSPRAAGNGHHRVPPGALCKRRASGVPFVLVTASMFLARIPDNAIDFISTDPPYSSVSVTVPGAPLPVMLMMTGCNLPAMMIPRIKRR